MTEDDAPRPDDGDASIGSLTLHGLRTADYLKAEATLTVQQKSALALRLTAALSAKIDSEEFADAEAILRLIIWNAQAPVTEALAHAAASNADTPFDLAWALANAHDEATAAPVLQACAALSDSDLIAIVEMTESAAKMTAIARRAAVGEGLSRSLARRGDEHTTDTLLSNLRAAIPEDAYGCMLDRFGEQERILGAMGARTALPSLIVERLSRMAAPQPDANAPWPGYAEQRDEQGWTELITELRAQKGLTAPFLVRQLLTGNFEMFTRAFADLTAAQPHKVSRELLTSQSAYLTILWGNTILPREWLPVACAALAALIEIDRSSDKSSRQVFCRNIRDRTLAILKSEAFPLSNEQRRIFARAGR